MTIPIKSQFIAFGAGVGLLIVGTVFMVISYWTPRLTEAHHTIAQNQAAITAIERQQQNLADISQQLSKRQEDQVKLNQELWGFSHEVDFYELWDPLGTATQTDVTLDSISEATPGEVPIRRDASVTIRGSLSNVWRAIARLPAITPIVVMQDFEFTPGEVAPAIVAHLTFGTLWYDDTLH